MKKYILFFIISLVIFVGHAIYTKHAIYGDGNGYYVTAQSLLYDHTFKSDKILGHLNNFPGKDYTFSRIFWDENKNPYSVGTSLIWMPALSIASIFSSNRFDLFHEIMTGLTGIILMLGELYYLERYLLNHFEKQTVFFTIFSIFLGSNIFYYSSFEPALSHQPAFFLISFLLYWTYKFTYSKKNLITLGLIFGLVHIVRIADTLLLIPIILNLKLDYKRIIYIGIGGALALTPQIAAQIFYYGSIFRNFYVTESANQWSIQLVHLFEYLFSFQKGLFIWSPIYLIGIFGLIKMRKGIILLTILSVWLLGSFWSSYSSMTAGFGQRLSLAAVPYFGLGIAYVYDKLRLNHQLIYVTIFTLWNTFLIYGFYVLKWKLLS